MKVLKADCWVGIHSFLVAKVRLQRESEIPLGHQVLNPQECGALPKLGNAHALFNKVWDSLKLLLWAGKFYGVLSTSSFGKREIKLSSIMPCLIGIVFLRPDPSFQVSFVQYSGFSEF
ncbi:uncharacterized protein LOC114418174 [Glycine soja]|uniref:uncharacterized protein LOC114418174 n=1 Tax=Glycine soja TaxID=3848 RepID=UPI00103E56C5|nr:uncharacterized protein LOC114418174 [Glycine soja]